MNRVRATRSAGAPKPSFEAVRSKILLIAYRHEQLKVSFDQLRSQIDTTLFETEDVFASLAMQLMKLVGLKTAEMAEENRFSTIVTSFQSSQPQPEDYMEKAVEASNEMMERQKLHLHQLISILKNIEAQVKSSQKSIYQDLASHQDFIRKLFLKASAVVSSVPCSGSNDLSHVMQKILKATFHHVEAAFGSVEVGVDGLITELAKKMCNPMVQYVQGLKVEMKTGTSLCLLEVVKEMHDSMQVRRVELEEAKNQTSLAEQRLKKSEETSKKLMSSLRLLTKDTTPHQEEQSINVKEEQAKDESLIWELLRQKRKSSTDSNPVGSNELLGLATSSKKPPSKRVSLLLTHSHSHRPVRSQFNHSNSLSSSSHSKMLLGSSPSATTQKVLCGKRVTP